MKKYANRIPNSPADRARIEGGSKECKRKEVGFKGTRGFLALLCYSSFQQVLGREIPFSAASAEVGMRFQPGKFLSKLWEAGLGWGGFRSGKILP